jgi:WD40 repeat protein
MDNEHILVSGASEGVQLWEIKSQKLIHSLPGITTAYLSPNEQYILVSQDETSWDLWNIWEGIKLHTFPYTIVPHFTPDSKWVALSDQYIGLLLSSIQKPEVTHAILPAGKNPTGWDFSADGKYIIMPDESGHYVLIDVKTGKTAHTFRDFRPTRWHFRNNAVLFIEFATRYEIKTKIRILDLNDFTLMTTASVDTGDVFNAAFTYDYKFLLTASVTSEYVLTDMETFQVVARFC